MAEAVNQTESEKQQTRRNSESFEKQQTKRNLKVLENSKRNVHCTFCTKLRNLKCIPGLKPLAVGDLLLRLLLVVPVAEHHIVAATPELALLAQLHHQAALRIDQLDLHQVQRFADIVDRAARRILWVRHRHAAARLRTTVSDQKPLYVGYSLHKSTSHFHGRRRRTGYDAWKTVKGAPTGRRCLAIE